MKLLFTKPPKTLLPLIFLAFLFTFSCSSKEEKNTAEILYKKAYELLKDKDYQFASEAFEKIDDEFPYNKWAIKGQVMSIYCQYKLKEFDKVAQIADDFIKLYPSSEYAPYALYMKGLGYYRKIPSIERSQDHTTEASFSFRELIARFPDSPYIADSKEKIAFIDEHLAGAKMSIGRNQIKAQNYVGALKNFEEVIHRYRLTNQAPEAYYRILEIYYFLGIVEESDKLIKILQAKYPSNYWTQQGLKLKDKNQINSDE